MARSLSAYNSHVHCQPVSAFVPLNHDGKRTLLLVEKQPPMAPVVQSTKIILRQDIMDNWSDGPSSEDSNEISVDDMPMDDTSVGKMILKLMKDRCKCTALNLS